MKNNVLNKAKKTIIVVFLISLLSALFYSLHYSSELEEQIWERDLTIQDLTFRSKLVEKYFDIDYNQDNHTIYYSLKDSIRNSLLVSQKESFNLLKDDLHYSIDSLLVVYNSLVRQHNEVIDEYNLLAKKYNSLSREKQKLQSAVSLIQRHYKISYETTVNSDTIITTLINTETVDSALILLPYYRDKIERVSDNQWLITH